MVISIIKFFIPAERRVDAMELLRSMQDRLEVSGEHVSLSIHERDYPNPHILYAEQWKSEKAIYKHIRSSIYRFVLAAMELSIRPPEVNFYFVSEIKGMELIHELRLQSLPASVSA